MASKKKITILVDSEVIKKAHELGLNVSKVCENCLKQYIEALTNLKMTNGGSPFLGEASFGKEGSRGCPSLVGGRPAKPVVSNGRVGSNPTPRAIVIMLLEKV